MRIDKQLEANQIRRALESRFKAIFYRFNEEDYQNPVTRLSIQEALTNIKRELEKVL